MMDEIEESLPKAKLSTADIRLSSHLSFRRMIDAAYKGDADRVKRYFDAAVEGYKKSDSLRNSYWLGLLYCSFGYSWYMIHRRTDPIQEAEAVGYFRAGRKMIPDRDISCFSSVPPRFDRDTYQIAAVAELEAMASARKRRKLPPGFEVSGDFSAWKERLDDNRIAVFASIYAFDPLIKKLALPRGRFVDEDRFLVSHGTLAEVGRLYRWWRDGTIGKLALDIPLGTKVKIGQFLVKTMTSKDSS